MQKEQKRGEKPYLTLLGVLSALSVVILHTNGTFWKFSADRCWITANVINSVFIFAVPVFFMMSGATLMDYRDRYDTRTFFRKRAAKTFIPFVAWTVICILIRLFYLRILTVGQLTPLFLLKGFFRNDFNSVYWFFWPLFGCYLSLPLLSCVPKEQRRGAFSYIVLVCFAVNIAIPFALRHLWGGVPWPISVGAVSGYPMYLLIGYLIASCEMPRALRYVLYGLGLAGLAAYIVGTQVLSFRAGKIDETFSGYLNVPCVLYSTAVFTFFRYTGDRVMRHPALRRPVELLGQYTFAVYLVHKPVMWVLEKEFSIPTRSIIYRLGGCAVIVPLCMLIAWLLRRIPIIRKIIP